MKVNKKLVRNILILAVLIKPMVFLYIDIIDKLYDALRIIVLIYIIVRYISMKKYSKFTLIAGLFNLTLLVSTVINDGDMIHCIGFIINTMGLIFFTEIMMVEDIDLMFKSFIKLLDIYLVINTLSLMLPDGLIHNFVSVTSLDGTVHTEKRIIYFLGIDNRFIFFYIPLIYFRFCYSYYKYDKLRKSDIFVYIVCILTLLYKWSVGAVIGLILYIPFIIYIVNRKSKIINRVMNLFTYFGSILVANYLIVVAQIQFLFEDFIVNVLKKDPTLSSRTLVWQSTIKWIAKKPILGNGYEFENIAKIKMHGANHPHNYILQMLYRGGIIYFSLFVVLIILAGNKLKKYPDNKISKTIAFSIFIALVMCIADSFDFALFLVMIQLGYHIETLINRRE